MTGIYAEPNPLRRAELEGCVERGIEFLIREQLSTGEVVIRCAYDLTNPDSWQHDGSIVATAFALCSLQRLGRRRLDLCDFERRAVAFLTREMLAPGAWSYWTADNSKRIGPDIDDTALASFALRLHHPHIRLGSNIRLILGNQDTTGLFKTWFRPDEEPNDIDPIVNANVLLYLGDRPEVKRAVAYLNELVYANRGEFSWYYLHDEAFYYAVARAFARGVADLGASRMIAQRRLRERQRSDGSYGDFLATAYAICALLDYGDPDKDMIGRGAEYLMAGQRPDGSWPLIAACAGPEPPGRHTVWWGSAELTTTLAVEALGRICDECRG
jgi:hypothetical protein